MFTGESRKVTLKAAAVKRAFKTRGWTYRAAEEVLGVTYQHICLVLNGDRQSRRLLAKIAALPRRVEVAR